MLLWYCPQRLIDWLCSNNFYKQWKYLGQVFKWKASIKAKGFQLQQHEENIVLNDSIQKMHIVRDAEYDIIETGVNSHLSNNTYNFILELVIKNFNILILLLISW